MNSTKSHIVLKIVLCGAFLLVELLSQFSISLAQGPLTEKAPMPSERSALCTAVLDGKIYAIGGLRNEEAVLSVVEVYDPATDSWDTELRTPMPTARCVIDCAVVDGKIYVFGGSNTGGPSILSTVEVYDPATDTWNTKTPLPTPRSDVAVEAINGKIYVIGGSKRTGSLWAGLNTVEEYDPVADTWATKSNMPTARWSLGTCVVDGKIYAIGGNIQYPTISSAVEVYDPATDTWSVKAPMPTARYSLATSFVNGKIYAFGGWRASGGSAGDPIYKIVEEYDVNTNTWIRKTDMPLTIALLSTETLNGKIYLIGGTNTQHTFNSLNTIYEYNPILSIPVFTRIDTGAIYSSTGHHIASGWFDMDNDDDMDVIITNSSGYNYRNHPNLMYKNEGNGYFTQVKYTEYTLQILKAGLPSPFGDIDNDGDQDLINLDWMGTKSSLYRNDGYGNFENLKDIDQLSGATSVLFDLDNDSYLDLVQFHEDDSRVYINDGTGNFVNSKSLNISCLDLNTVLHNIALGDADNDGDFDLYMGYTNIFSTSSYKAKNEFFLNNGSGVFERHSEDSIIVQDLAMTPSINWIDYDNDGDMDLYVLNSFDISPANSVTGALFENKGGLVFEKHIIEPAGYRDANRISSVWGDLDNDADLDLYITIEKNIFNGHASPIIHNLLLQNNGDGTFSEASAATLAEESSHTATFEDFDNDGDLDVLLVRFSWANNGNNTLCMNEGNDNSWLILTLEGTSSNRTAFGARIIAKATINGQYVTQTREITPMSGHGTYNSTRVHFGLGDADQVDTLIIRWPSGHVNTYLQVPANEIHHFIEKENAVGTRQVTSKVLKEDILIYPNPTNNLLTIETGMSGPYNIDIISLNGQLIFSEDMKGTLRQIDLSSFRKGVYFITIKSKDFVITKKTIKL